MLPAFHSRIALGALTLLLAQGLSATELDPRKVPDKALERGQAIEAWHGGRASANYLDQKRKIQENEFNLWENLIPGTPGFGAPTRSGIPAKQWVNIGPLRGQGQLTLEDDQVADTGRPTVILPHPTKTNVLYVGYAGGGLWKCENADLDSDKDWRWTPLTDSLPAGSSAGNLSIGGAAFAPEDPETLFLALGDMSPGSADSTADGRGFYITHDGGKTWTRGGDLGETTRVKSVVALTGDVVLVSGNDGLFRSVDGGQSFTRVEGDTLKERVGWDLVALPSGRLVLAHQMWNNPGNGGIATSEDGGLTWKESVLDAAIQTMGLRRIALAASQDGTIYGLPADSKGKFQKGVIKSVDGGLNWAWVASPEIFNVSGDGGQAGYNHMIAVDPENSQTAFVGTNLSLYRSLNGGKNWERVSQWMGSDRHYIHADFHVHAWNKAPGLPKTLFLGTDGGLSVVKKPTLQPIPTGVNGVKSDVSFIDNRRNRNIATQMIYHIGSTTAKTPAGSRDRVIIGLQDQGTRLRTSGGTRYQNYDMTLGGDGFGCAIHPLDGNKMLGSLYYTRVYRSVDGGWSWGLGSGIAGAGNSSSAPFFTRLSLDPSDPTGDRVYTATNALPYVSDNFGASWRAMSMTGIPTTPAPVIRNIVGSSLPNHVAMAMNGGRVAFTMDGSNWTVVPGTALPNNPTYMSYATFGKDSKTLFAASVAFNATASHIWKTADGGQTFKALDVENGFPFGVPVHVIKVDPMDADTVYAGTDMGIYRSTDGGDSWARFGSGLPLVSVRDIYLAPDGTFMRIGTHGRGVWEMQGVSESYAPIIHTQPQTVTAFENGNATLGVVAAALPAPTFQWQISLNGTDWAELTGANQSLLPLEKVTSADLGKQYRVQVTNALGSVTSQSAGVNLIQPQAPIFSLNPQSVQQVQGLRVDLKGMAAGNPAPTFQWQHSKDGVNWLNLAGQTQPNFTFYAQKYEKGRQFRLAATNLGGTTYSQSATLTLTPDQVQLLTNPDFEMLPFGQGWTWSDANMSTNKANLVKEGARALYLGEWGKVYTDWGYQNVTLPYNPSKAELSLSLKLVNAAGVPKDKVVNTLTVKLRNTQGQELATLATLDNTTVGFENHTQLGPFDLKAYGGQSVQIYLTSTQTEASLNTAFYIDDVRVMAGSSLPASLDVNGDGAINMLDALEVLKRYRIATADDLARVDFDGDGFVTDKDFTTLLNAF